MPFCNFVLNVIPIAAQAPERGCPDIFFFFFYLLLPEEVPFTNISLFERHLRSMSGHFIDGQIPLREDAWVDG